MPAGLGFVCAYLGTWSQWFAVEAATARVCAYLGCLGLRFTRKCLPTFDRVGSVVVCAYLSGSREIQRFHGLGVAVLRFRAFAATRLQGTPIVSVWVPCRGKSSWMVVLASESLLVSASNVVMSTIYRTRCLRPYASSGSLYSLTTTSSFCLWHQAANALVSNVVSFIM